MEGDYIRILFHRLIHPVFPFLLLMLLLVSCSSSEENAQPVKKKEFALPVQVGKVVTLDVADEVRTVGNIQAEQRLSLIHI